MCHQHRVAPGGFSGAEIGGRLAHGSNYQGQDDSEMGRVFSSITKWRTREKPAIWAITYKVHITHRYNICIYNIYYIQYFCIMYLLLYSHPIHSIPCGTSRVEGDATGSGMIPWHCEDYARAGELEWADALGQEWMPLRDT